MKYRKRWIVAVLLLCFFVQVCASEPDSVCASPEEAAQQEEAVQQEEEAAQPEEAVQQEEEAAQQEQAAKQEQITQPAVDQPPAKLVLDCDNLYNGMDRTYAQGYLPKVENKTAYIVAPILSTGRLKEQCVRVSLNLGDAENTPFVMKSYEKKVSLAQNRVNGQSSTVDSYLVEFSLELKEERCNGSYPVMLNVTAQDEQGNELEAAFYVYVTVTDGKDPGQMTGEEKPPVFAPKVLVQTCRFSGSEILAGDTVTMDITLVNTSKTEAVKNLSAALEIPAEQFMLLSESDTIYMGNLGAGETCTLSYLIRVHAETAGGQYSLNLTMDYNDTKGNSYTENGRARIDIRQPLCLQFDPLLIARQAAVADVVEARVQAMNLGRGMAYNVRAVIEADGLCPQGTIFIGDMEAGSQASAGTMVTVGSMSGSTMYGETKGTVTFYYEDAMGEEKTETAVFTMSIVSPFLENAPKQQDKTEQWWVIMAVIGGILGISAATCILRRVRIRKERKDETME